MVKTPDLAPKSGGFDPLIWVSFFSGGFNPLFPCSLFQGVFLTWFGGSKLTVYVMTVSSSNRRPEREGLGLINMNHIWWSVMNPLSLLPHYLPSNWPTNGIKENNSISQISFSSGHTDAVSRKNIAGNEGWSRADLGSAETLLHLSCNFFKLKERDGAGGNRPGNKRWFN